MNRIHARLQEEEFMRGRLEVPLADYVDAVESLLPIAMGDTGGSRAAAQLLLSIYNGYKYHMDLTDLCVLDLSLLEKAFIVLRGRVMLAMEPHSIIENGAARFLELEELWPELHIKRRYNREKTL